MSDDSFLERIGITKDDLRRARERNKRRRLKMNPLRKNVSQMEQDDMPHFMQHHQIMMGAYGVRELVVAQQLNAAFEKKTNRIMSNTNWLVPAGFSLISWAKKYFTSYVFTEHNMVTAICEDGVVEATLHRQKLTIELTWNPETHDAKQKELVSELQPIGSVVEWVFDSRGGSISVPLNFRPAINAANPWVNGDVMGYIDNYINSEASVLILIGPPGTGKTTFIKNLIHRSKSDAKVTYDPNILSNDAFFASFVEDDSMFLVMEDADSFLASRKDGNTLMHRFLNMSDGLISSKGKKLVFSTNLPNINDIDEALLRPGRCFDILQFRALNRDEAQAVLDEVKSDRALPDGDQFTLAEIFGQQPSIGDGVTKKVRRNRVGFA
jgi:hypothetical protein